MKVLCIGHVTYDIMIDINGFPLENTKNRINKVLECGGGQVCNATYLLGKWGISTYLLGLIGNDKYGKIIKDELDSVGVNTTCLEMTDKTTVSYIVVNNKNGSRTSLTYHPNNLKMQNVNENINPDIILMDGYEYEFALKMINKYPNAISVLDAEKNNEQVIKLCKLVDYVICSKVFLESFSNIKIIDEKTLNQALEYANKFFKKVIVTLEDKGCAYENKIIPTIKVKAVDSTGAGDIFHGAFVYGLIQKWDIDKILYFANVAGSLSVTKFGSRNSVFSKEDVMKVANEFVGNNIYR